MSTKLDEYELRRVEYELRRVESERQRLDSANSMALQEALDQAERWKAKADMTPAKADLEALEELAMDIASDCSSLRDKIREIKRKLK